MCKLICLATERKQQQKETNNYWLLPHWVKRFRTNEKRPVIFQNATRWQYKLITTQVTVWMMLTYSVIKSASQIQNGSFFCD